MIVPYGVDAGIAKTVLTGEVFTMIGGGPWPKLGEPGKAVPLRSA